ncbi:NHL repeat-containing protein [Geobacillus stearothermophilus]
MLTDLGPKVRNISVNTSRAAMDKKGNCYLYMILHGTPTVLAVLDLNTGKVKKTFPLLDSTAAWAMDIDEGGVLWIGGTNKGSIYRFDPNTFSFKNFGNQLGGSKEVAIQDITHSNQKLFATTAYGANFFSFSKAKGKRVSGLSPLEPGKKFAKSIVYDQGSNTLFISLGAKANLLKWNLSTGKKEHILPLKYQSETYIYKMRIVNQYLFARMYPSEKIAVYDMKKNRFVAEFPASSIVSNKNPFKNEVYYTYKGKFYRFDLKTLKTYRTNLSLPPFTEAISLDFVKKKNGETVLTGLVDNDGRYYELNPIRNRLVIRKPTLPAQPVNLYTMTQSLDGSKIIINGYMSGGLCIYDVDTKKEIELKPVSQLETILVTPGKMYLGAYPKARLLEYDLASKWKGYPINPRKLLNLLSYGQTRITALIKKDNTLLLGTYPENSTGGGVLALYDTVSGKSTVYPNFINNQSIISLLAYKDGYIYGGTSRHANYKVSKEPARFFRFKLDNPKRVEFLPIPLNSVMISSLIEGPDGNIWGMANGTLFQYNPSTNSFKTKQILKAISGRFKNAVLVNGKNGLLYGTVEGKLFEVDPSTMKVTILLDHNAWDLAIDKNGTLYVRNLERLYSFQRK